MSYFELLDYLSSLISVTLFINIFHCRQLLEVQRQTVVAQICLWSSFYAGLRRSSHNLQLTVNIRTDLSSYSPSCSHLNPVPALTTLSKCSAISKSYRISC